MRVTLLGHATVLVESAGRNVLIDPVLLDSAGEGALVPCPARRIERRRLPRIDMVFLSQREPDHFDIPSLAELPRDRLVVCPQDEMMTYALTRLGFENVKPVAWNSILALGGCEVLTTPSARNPAELGVALRDDNSSFWHQSDSEPTAEMFAHVRKLWGQIDLLFASFAPQHFAYWGSQRGGYPASAIRGVIDRIKRMQPRMVVPGSMGVRLNGPFEWVNAFAFPVSVNAFLGQLELLAPEIPRARGLPGDVFEIVEHAVVHRPSSSRIAAVLEDDTHRVEFDPSAAVPPLRDPNLQGYTAQELSDSVEQAFEGVTALVRAGYISGDPAVADLRRRRLTYAISVVFPDGVERWLKMALLGDAPVVSRGEGRVRGAVTTHRTVASLVTALLRADHGYLVTGGLSRLSLISPADVDGDNIVLRPHEPRDLLIEYLARARDGQPPLWRRQLDRQLAPYCVA